MDFEYHLVDVFTQKPLEGNGLAVFSDASELDAVTMQRIAREMNQSETTFICPKNGSATTQVRIFTPTYEMEFAGHPTIGTAFVMRQLGIVPDNATEFIIQENVGPIQVRIDRGPSPLIWLTTPRIELLQTYPRKACAEALGLQEQDLLPGVPCELLSAGNPNIFVAVRDPATVDRAAIDVPLFLNLIKSRSGTPCLFVFAPTSGGAYARMFAPELGIIEDPATGSATGPLAVFMMQHGLMGTADLTRFVSEQGTQMGRRSFLHVLIHGERGAAGVEVGGYVCPIAIGKLSLEVSDTTCLR